MNRSIHTAALGALRLAGGRAYERQVAEAKAAGLPIPRRSGFDIFQAPAENAPVFDINRGE